MFGFGFDITTRKTCECQKSLSLAGDLFTRCKCDPKAIAEQPEKFGASCKRCGEYNHHVKDDGAFCCYQCRSDPFR